MGKWLSYPKAEQKILAEAWRSNARIVELGPDFRVDFGEMKENGKIPIRRIESRKVEGRGRRAGGQNSPLGRGKNEEDPDGSQRDCFEYYDSGKDRWVAFSPGEDKILKNAWLKGHPTVRFDAMGTQYEVSFEMLKVKKLNVSVQDAALPDSVRSIRHPIKFGPFRRVSKVHNFEDVFDDIIRGRRAAAAAGGEHQGAAGQKAGAGKKPSPWAADWDFFERSPKNDPDREFRRTKDDTWQRRNSDPNMSASQKRGFGTPAGGDRGSGGEPKGAGPKARARAAEEEEDKK